MCTLDELKPQWESSFKQSTAYDAASFNKLIKARIRKHTRAAMHYFWASFALQVIVYALFTHVLVKYWLKPQMVVLSLAGVFLFLPFTILLMNKFKRFFKSATQGTDAASIHESIVQQRAYLASFFRFKKRYELVLIPLSSAIGVILVFALHRLDAEGNIQGKLKILDVGEVYALNR